MISLLTLSALSAHEVRHERARAAAMALEVARLKADLAEAQREHGGSLRALWMDTQKAPAGPLPQGSARTGEVKPGLESRRPPAQVPAPLEPTEVGERMNAAFHGERADTAWAGAAQRMADDRLRAALPPGSEVRAVECRATLCRIETSHQGRERYLEFVRKAFGEPATQVWNGGAFSTPLEDASEAEGQFVAVTYFAKDGQSLPTFE